MRRGKIKYLCKECKKWFQINRTKTKPSPSLFLVSHLRGTSFRSLGEAYDIAPATAYRKSLKALETLPHIADITREYCSRFCGVLVVDGKYVKVKGYERKIPVFYGIDYLTHDIPTYLFSVSESYQTCHSFFTSLKLLNYPLVGIVSDDNMNIYEACKAVYPKALTQLCYNHYKETLRATLSVRTENTYVPFMKEVEKLLAHKRAKEELDLLGRKLFEKYKHNSLAASILLDFHRRLPLLTAYMGNKTIPLTTNLIESYNSHLEARVRPLKGFESFKHADLFLNAYFLRRRLKVFTDCTTKFRSLNGTRSLEHTMTDPTKLEKLLSLLR